MSSAAATSAARFVDARRGAGQARSRPAPACVSRSRAVAVRNLSRTATSNSADGVLTRDAARRRRRPGHRPRRRGHRRHRAGARADHRRRCAGGKPVVTANKELLANVGVELFARRRRRRVSTCCSRPPSPAASRSSAALRESLRGEPITPRDGHRQRHDQLHPHQDDRGGRRLRRGARRGAARSGSPSATRPPTSRASTPAPRRRSWRRSRSGRRSSPATSTTRASATITAADIDVARRLGYVVKLLGDRRARRGDGEHRACACIRRWCRCTIRWPASATASTRCSSRVRAVGSLMFYGRGAGGPPTASAVLGDVIDAAVNLIEGHARLARHVRQGAHPADRRDVGRVPPRPRGRRPARACCTRSPVCSPSHDVSIRAAEQEGIGPDARLVFITHEAQESAVQATVRELRELDVGAQRRRPAPRDRRADVREYVSTRGRAPELGSPTSCSPGLATDGGLYVPGRWPSLPPPTCSTRRRTYADVAAAVMQPFVGDEIAPAALAAMCARRLRDVPPPGRRPARADRPPTSGSPSCSTARRWRSRTSPCSSSAGCSTTCSAQRGERVTIVGATERRHRARRRSTASRTAHTSTS